MVLVTLLAFLLSLLLGSIAGRLADRYDRKNNVKIKDGSDANAIVGYMMSVILEGALHEEMNEELGYSKYDSRNKKQIFPEDHAHQLWRLIFHGTEKGNMNLRQSKNTTIPSPRT